MAVSEKSKANLIKFTSETAKEAQRKSAAKRHSNTELIKMIDGNFDYILNVLSKCKTDKEFEKAVENCPNYFVKIYLKDISKEQLARIVVEGIIDRVKGKPKQSEDVNVTGEMNYKFKFGDE